MKAFHCEFKRSDIGKLSAEIHIEKKKSSETRIVKFDYDFDCLPYILRDLSKLWQEERQCRMNAIQRLNSRLPDVP